MHYTVLTITLVTMLASGPAMANKPSKEENIGVGTGAVIGAVAGGPVGLIVGAAFGAKLGDEFHGRNERIDSLSVSLEDSRDDLARLTTDIETLSAELGRVQQSAHPEAANLLRAGIAMDLLFRTDEAVLADATGSRLAELGGLLASMPDVRIQLDGFADERGDEVYNHALSRQRVEFVRNRLVAAGVDGSRIRTAAHGEVPAADDTLDSLALERRVSMTVSLDDSRSFASNHD